MTEAVPEMKTTPFETLTRLGYQVPYDISWQQANEMLSKTLAKRIILDTILRVLIFVGVNEICKRYVRSHPVHPLQ